MSREEHKLEDAKAWTLDYVLNGRERWNQIAGSAGDADPWDIPEFIRLVARVIGCEAYGETEEEAFLTVARSFLDYDGAGYVRLRSIRALALTFSTGGATPENFRRLYTWLKAHGLRIRGR